MRTYSNAVIEHYADRFMGLRLARHGVTLEQYLADPQRYEARALEPEPPLPAQRAVALKLWWAWDTGLAPRGDACDPAPLPDNHQDWRELLAQWRAEAEQAERPLAHLPQRNGVIVEPLHHHRFERRHNADFTKRGA